MNSIHQKYEKICALQKLIEVEKVSLIDDIEDYLKTNPPFKENSSFEEDVKSFQDLVDLCLMVDPHTFKTKWIFLPILENQYTLGYDIERYVEVFDKLWRRESSKPKKVIYWEIYDFFQSLP